MKSAIKEVEQVINDARLKYSRIMIKKSEDITLPKVLTRIQPHSPEPKNCYANIHSPTTNNKNYFVPQIKSNRVILPF